MQRLETAMCQEAVERRGYGTDTILYKAQLRVQVLAIGADDTHDHIRMSADVSLKSAVVNEI
jgi:hypothetical protein